MRYIVFYFEGKELRIEPSISFVTLLTDGNTKFRFNGEDYVVIDKIFYGLEQQAFNDAKAEELRKTKDYNGEFSGDVLELHVKLKKV